jgi:hypothetical protein
MFCRVALVITEVSEERSFSIIRVTRIVEVGTSHPDDGGATFLRNVGSDKSHTAQHPRRRHSSFHISFVKFNVFFYCGVPLSEAELMVWYISIFPPISSSL